jgi:heme exporter protein D
MSLLSEGGRYAPYILAAFAVTAVVFAGLIADTLLRARHWRREVERLTRRDEGPSA